MVNVTSRVKQVTQPRGGYVPSKLFKKIPLDDDYTLNPNEDSHKGTLIGLTVDYFSRFLLGASKQSSWGVSLIGADTLNATETADQLLSEIDGLNDQSLQAAYRLSGFDVAKRANSSDYRDVMGPEFTLSAPELSNLKILINRVMHFFNKFGKPTKSGMTFQGGYSPVISSGDADFMTIDTLWDLKVLRSNTLDKKYKLQILVYYLMGLRSFDEADYQSIEYIGLFNPRENVAYRCDINDIPEEVIRAVENDVIGY
ncbi:hypothetical protein ACYATP_07475 [Lactobacillaceae bacterium Melli_B4]